MARESKAELLDRLRREGQWESFKKHREALKAEGVPAKEAWWRAATEFPLSADSPVDKPQGRPLTKVEIRAIEHKPRIKTGQAIRWAFDHLEGDWVQPRDAPSVGAWSLREWARSSLAARGEFYRLFAAKMLVLPSEDETTPQRLSKKDRDFYMKFGFAPDLPKGWTKRSRCDRGGGG